MTWQTKSCLPKILKSRLILNDYLKKKKNCCCFLKIFFILIFFYKSFIRQSAWYKQKSTALTELSVGKNGKRRLSSTGEYQPQWWGWDTVAERKPCYLIIRVGRNGEEGIKPIGNIENDITALAHLPAHTAGETWDKQFCSSAPSVSGVKAFSLSSRLLERYVCQNTHVCGRDGVWVEKAFLVSREVKSQDNQKRHKIHKMPNKIYTYTERNKKWDPTLPTDT